MKFWDFMAFILWEAMTIGAGIYLIFWKEANPWWMLLFVMLGLAQSQVVRFSPTSRKFPKSPNDI